MKIHTKHNPKQRKLYKSDAPELVVGGQAMTPRELYNRLRRGQPVPELSKTGNFMGYSDEEIQNIGLENIQDISRLDKIERIQAARENQVKIRKNLKKIEKHKKAVELAKARLAESKKEKAKQKSASKENTDIKEG